MMYFEILKTKRVSPRQRYILNQNLIFHQSVTFMFQRNFGRSHLSSEVAFYPSVAELIIHVYVLHPQHCVDINTYKAATKDSKSKLLCGLKLAVANTTISGYSISGSVFFVPVV